MPKTKKVEKSKKKKSGFIIDPRIIIVVAVLALLIIIGFSDFPVLEEEQWENPPIHCNTGTTNPVYRVFPVEEGEEYEFDGQYAVEMTAFCKRMQANFKESNLSPKEAEAFYEILEASATIKDKYRESLTDEYVTMGKLCDDELKQRLAVRKLDNIYYEVFYVVSDCGLNYKHSVMKIVDNEVTEEELIETWVSGWCGG